MMNDLKRLGVLICTVFLFISLLAGPASAQEQEYRIGLRDVIGVNVFAGGEEQISEDVTVAADGMITLPLLGAVPADGLTLSELKKNSIEPLALKYFIDPQVTVSIKEYHSLSFYISGSVAKPGHYELDKKPTILELIAKAGGMMPDHGHSAYIMRESHDPQAEKGTAKPIVIDLKPLMDYGDMTNNIELATGDVIHIPRENELDQATNSIFVEGELKNPGVYPFQQGITALSACILAGGFNDYAAPNRAKIIRGRGKFKFSRLRQQYGYLGTKVRVRIDTGADRSAALGKATQSG